ncbi:MAG: peptide-methionine (R)-S-oxide reductase MsrB [Gallionella sp.]|nr:peptide-methionine (R)-S-oxide reductase MsrB [Gallionella sp.]
MNRRQLLIGASGLLVSSLLPAFAKGNNRVAPLVKSKSEWKALLPADRYAVLFEAGTEPAGSSPLDREKRAGTFICAACYLPLFDSATKYDSGTGWPSFYDYLSGSLLTETDFKLIWPRTEYHCARCGGHQGHVFDDGPKPTGLRYCNNGLALQFVPRTEKLPELRT